MVERAEDALRALVSDHVTIHSAYEIFEQPILRGDYVYFRTDHHWTALGLSCHAVDRETTDIKPFRWRITMSSTIDGFWVRSICTGAARS
ncbi:MAG: DHHW family protein [Eubacteriales bacterium]